MLDWLNWTEHSPERNRLIKEVFVFERDGTGPGK